MGCLLYFLKNKHLHHPKYVQKATEDNISAVYRPDRKALLDYLYGKETKDLKNIDEMVSLEMPTKSHEFKNSSAEVSGQISQIITETTIDSDQRIGIKERMERKRKISEETGTKLQENSNVLKRFWVSEKMVDFCTNILKVIPDFNKNVLIIPDLLRLMLEIPTDFNSLSDYAWSTLRNSLIQKISNIFQSREIWSQIFLDTLETWKKLKPNADQSSISILRNTESCSEAFLALVQWRENLIEKDEIKNGTLETELNIKETNEMVKRAKFEIDDSLKIANVEKNDPIPQIGDELKAAMINECVEKLVSPKVIAIHYKEDHGYGRNINSLKNHIFKWVKLSGKLLPAKFEITTYGQYKRSGLGQKLIQTPENPQPDEIMSDDVSIEAYEKNNSDKEIDDSLKVDNEEEKHPLDQISDELRADMVKECVEKLVSPKVLAVHYKNVHGYAGNINYLRNHIFKWVKLSGKLLPAKFEITTYEQYINLGFSRTFSPIEGYEKNDSDKETAEIDCSQKIGNEEKNDPIDQISNESKAAMVNECVEKLVCPKVLAIHYKETRNIKIMHINKLKKEIKMWVQLAGKSFPTKFNITTCGQYKKYLGQTFIPIPENPQPDKPMNDDVSIEENESDEETAEINNCLKSNNEEKNVPIDQISNELKAAMVNECVEKLVTPKVIAIHYKETRNLKIRNINKLKRLIKVWVKLAGKSYPAKYEITTYDQYKACYGPTIVLTPENIQPDDVATESRNSMISSIKESIDFEKVSSLDPDTELLSYIKVVAHGYKDAISSS